MNWPHSERIYNACLRAIKELDRLDKFEDIKKGKHPYVSAIILDRNGYILKDQNGKELIGLTDPKTKKHAEAKVIEKVLSSGEEVFRKAYMLITTLEPCSYRDPTKHQEEIACAKLISYAGITQVVIGMLDPSLTVRGRGLALLDRWSVYYNMFPPELAVIVRQKNKKYIDNIEKQIMYPYVTTISPIAEFQLQYAPKSIRDFMDEKEIENLIDEIKGAFRKKYTKYNNLRIPRCKKIDKFQKDLREFAREQLSLENSPSKTLIEKMNVKRIGDYTIFQKIQQYLGYPTQHYDIEDGSDYEFDRKLSILLMIYNWVFW